MASPVHCAACGSLHLSGALCPLAPISGDGREGSQALARPIVTMSQREIAALRDLSDASIAIGRGGMNRADYFVPDRSNQMISYLTGATNDEVSAVAHQHGFG